MKLYKLIYKLLQEQPHLRDSDKALAWEIWSRQGVVVNGALTEHGFMNAEHFETLRRTRQKVQEEHEEVRSNPIVQLLKDEKRATKGTFVYKEDVDLSKYHKEYIENKNKEVRNEQPTLL